mgnify:CR=1 FL=1
MQRKRSQNSGRIIDMKHYTVEITNEALAERISIMESESERSKDMRRLLVDKYFVFFASIIIKYYLFVTALSLA